MKAEYINHMGDDLLVVNAARVSFDKESDWIYSFEGDKTYGSLGERDCKLLNYLAKHNHWTPFSHPQICMRETVPIFVARQRFKHMVGFTYNEVSRRYVDDEPEFYTPNTWRSRPEGSVKQGSGGELSKNQGFGGSLGSPYEMAAYAYQHAVNTCAQSYDNLLKVGVAPEQARMVLPQSMLTSYYVTGSLAAWARAYKQRIESTAQIEIQELAKQWGSILSPLFPESWAVLTNSK